MDVQLWAQWLVVNGVLLAIYFVWDPFWFYPREAKPDIVRDETRVHRLRFQGVWPNAVLLAGVILSIALLDPAKPFPGTDWHPWLYLREMVQLGLVLLSLALGRESVRRANQFNYHAIVEVAVLFLGIFICMQPPLQILHVRGPALGLTTPPQFFWATGSLSSVLDNAPTYVVFFETAGHAGRNRLGGRRPRGTAGRRQPRRGVHGGDDVHRQRAELHGQDDRREIGRPHAQLLRLPGLQLCDPPAAAGGGSVGVSSVACLLPVGSGVRWGRKT